ncbi:LuxR family transcriptional regulator [Cellulomonas sp. PhB150]|uniref:helix-turn-helix transcriptional regulator n=1 Tax=Cellulomonas sp. PhB150 TaxID=2485188 RepID=UPI000F47960E|nr:LuxR family transcriptional regulator [Cellulomonas sp. PhB150]ROS27835.1 regulatory LuxR family protein [Cellulomonas sp. PhB150]
MLVGRERERQVLRSLAAAARVGEGGTLVVVGEAGIGKSALLSDFVASSLDAGMRVLQAAGVSAEREVPFGGLLQLLRPVLDHLDGLPSPQADALGAALALRPGAESERFAVGAAVLGLLSRVAEDAPLVLVVDDAHLLDLPTAQALTFAARRLSSDPVAVVLAVREGEQSLVTSVGLPVLAVTGLAADSADALLAGRGLPPSARSRLLAATGGNPLALLELPDDASLAALPDDAPVPVPASLARAFAVRADALSPAARTALLVAAAAGGDLTTTEPACAHLGVSAADLDEAVVAGLFTVSAGHVAFRHDLVRSAVWAEATPASRQAVHLALAAVLGSHDADRRAWHLGEATTSPDSSVAAALDEAAARAGARGAHAVAAAGYERAARLTPDAALRAARLLAGAEFAWRAGQPSTALDALAAVSALPSTPDLRLRAAALEGAVSIRTGAVEHARDLLLEAASTVTDADRAVELLADGILAAQFAGDIAAASQAAARIDDLLPHVRTPRTIWLGTMAAGLAGIIVGHGGPDRIRAAMDQAIDDPALLADPRLAPWLVMGPLFLREAGAERSVIPTVVGHVRRRADLGGLPILLFYVARDQGTTDRWTDAVATYTEGIALAREAGQVTDLVAGLAGLACVEARRGSSSALAHAEEALALATEHHIGFFQTWAYTALGDLALGSGRAQEALDAYQSLVDHTAALGFDDVDVWPAAEMVDALMRLDRAPEALALATRLSERAADKGQPWALARAARALGLTAPDDSIDDHFGAALELHARTPDTFETARTQLAYGHRLRLARRRVDSRPPLRAALATFDALGAAPWADQAAAELRATGETAHRRDVTGLDHLTPQELQVARTLAVGRTTREAAAALFLSPKTIEYHLRNVYAKLGVRSRAELTTAMADRP